MVVVGGSAWPLGLSRSLGRTGEQGGFRGYWGGWPRHEVQLVDCLVAEVLTGSTLSTKRKYVEYEKEAQFGGYWPDKHAAMPQPGTPRLFRAMGRGPCPVAQLAKA